jgi:hypothetical protein
LQRARRRLLYYQETEVENGYCFECMRMLNNLSSENRDRALILLHQLTSHPQEEVVNSAVPSIVYLSK